MEIWRKFYEMPSEYKDGFKKGDALSIGGYIAAGKEWLGNSVSGRILIYDYVMLLIN